MSKYFIPVLFFAVIVFALIKKVKPYDAFVTGAKGALPFVCNLFPYLTAIFLLTELFEASGLADLAVKFLTPVFRFVAIPPELIKLVLIKPFSGSGALANLAEIYSTYGVDSYLSRTASAIYGSSETVFYVAAVYFADSKTKNLFKPISVSLFASLFSFITACLICKFI